MEIIPCKQYNQYNFEAIVALCGNKGLGSAVIIFHEIISMKRNTFKFHAKFSL